MRARSVRSVLGSLAAAAGPLVACVPSHPTMVSQVAQLEVETAHAFTARMCAGSRYEETYRSDRLFSDPLAYQLAGKSGRQKPMGAWILVPRTRFGDDLLRDRYLHHGARQLVLLGAGMDARAYRMEGLEDLAVFEVDQQTTFDVKEPLLQQPLDESGRAPQLLVKRRHIVATDFAKEGQWQSDLIQAGFSIEVPTVWLLEGLMMYLTPRDGAHLMSYVGSLSAPGSVVFHDGCSRDYMRQGVAVAGAPFVGGSDDYAADWWRYGGFGSVRVYDFNRDLWVDRRNRRLAVRPEATATPSRCRQQLLVLFVVAEMLDRKAA